MQDTSQKRKTTGSNSKLFEGEPHFRQKRRKMADRWARWVVATGGFGIIASILAILIFILIEILPLFEPAEVTRLAQFEAGQIFTGTNLSDDPIVALGSEENQEVGYAVTRGGVIQFFSLVDNSHRERMMLDDLNSGEKIISVWQSLDGKQLALGTNEGRVLVVSFEFNRTFFEGKRSYTPEVESSSVLRIDPAGRAVQHLAFAGDPDESVAVAGIFEDGSVGVFCRTREESMFGDVESDSVQSELKRIWTGTPTSIALDAGMTHLYIGASDGKIYHWQIAADEAPEFVSSTRAAQDEDVALTQLSFLIGSRTLIVGDSDGKVSAWFLVRDNTARFGWRLVKIRDLYSHASAITTIAPSARRKGFIAGDRDGHLSLQYSTSERLLAEFRHADEAGIALINYAPKANAAMTLDERNVITHWQIDNPHPEAGFKAFFGKVWYEGYEKPEFVWQSTGGSDDFEPKLSLVPLIFGSIKGTLYALIIAIPLAILGAIYTSQFMHARYRNYIKPTVEIMAALPSVVLGFLAGLWLAPRIEDSIPGLLSMFIVLPLLILASVTVWNLIPRSFRGRFRPGVEAFFLLPVIVFGIWFCFELNDVLANIFFNGDFKVWLYQTMELRYDQRNALVVGFAMGFAVIPIIYTISEDALSNVPQNLVSGSLALGATRWQTAIKVVVPTAAAGIFSAIMIGLGRAVGETMIVLMATGNTPIMDWNIFNGFRTLSANIAVEIPEAPVGGTLYRVLFLAAMLLFLMTFLVNTLAEVVRQRLREKYQKL